MHVSPISEIRKLRCPDGSRWLGVTWSKGTRPTGSLGLPQPLHDKPDPSPISGDKARRGCPPPPACVCRRVCAAWPLLCPHPLTAPPGSPLPVTWPALWELSLNNTLMEKFMKNQIIAAGRELKPFFIPHVPGPRLRAPPWERCAHPIPLYGPPSQAQITAAILY